ncbi:MAG: hypothetical protein FJW90_07070 [Actinobacteria bacterium]|nr:hypothetical protein [Actinomycetota bacterium]
MLATYGSALLIVLASLYVGRAFFAVLGRRETHWLETPVGLAILLVVCSVLTRIHFGAENAGAISERTELALIACGLLLVGSIAYLRFGFADRDSFLMAAPVIAAVLVATALPFIASGHLGIPGIGVNNDMAAHLIFADWLQNPTGPSPNGLRIGYPLGPHGLVATVADALGTEPLYGFLGLLIAICVITGMTSLNVLGELAPVKRTIAATLVAVPYLVASTFGIAGFKEMMAGLFLLAFALILRELPRTERRLPWIAALGVLGAAMIANYSYPGLVWLAATGGIWALAEIVVGLRRGRRDEVRAAIRSSLPLVGVGLLLMLALALAELPRIKDFIDTGAVEIVSETDSKLRFPVPAPEALGVWPSGDWLFGYSDAGLDAWWLFAALGLAAFGAAALWWLRRSDLALPSAIAASALIYAGSIVAAGLYVEAKALQVPAALVMLFILGGLLLEDRPRPAAREPTGEPGGRGRRISARALIAIPFIALAAYSSFLALRDAVIAPTDRFDELEAFREHTTGAGVLNLTSDRYFDYYLRGADVRSPARNAELKFVGREGKAQRLPVDFDSVFPRQMNFFDYAVTTSADYQSGAPPNWEQVDRTESYVLWERVDRTPFVGALAEEARPGRIFRCSNPKFRELLKRKGLAITWPRPVVAKRLYWEVEGEPLADGDPDRGAIAELEPGQTATQTIELEAGEWQLSFQYSSEVSALRVEAEGIEVVAPAGLEGALPYRPDQGPYFPVGSVASEGGPVEIRVTAEPLSRLQRLLGVDATASLGNLVATRLEDLEVLRFAESCGLYLDHYYVGEPGALKVPRAAGGGVVDQVPTR